MLDYTNTTPELLNEVNAIFNKEIDPIFMDLARKIEPRIENPRYMPWLLAHKMSAECAKILMALPDPDWTPDLGDHSFYNFSNILRPSSKASSMILLLSSNLALPDKLLGSQDEWSRLSPA